jgi:DNA-binding XRE family transcriptional regulator
MKTPREILDELSVWAKRRHGRQAKLATLLGVKPQTFCDWAAGRSTPKWEIGMKIEEFLGKPEKERKEILSSLVEMPRQ